jgi:hypothetical protein
MLSPFGPKIGPNSFPGPTAMATTTRSSQVRPSLPPSHRNRMNYLWSVVTSSHDAVLRQRLLLPQTQLDARDRIPNQAIASQPFLGVPGWGWGANVLSYSPNLAHCAVQTSSMQHPGFATQWSEARRLAPRGHVTPKLHGVRIRTFRPGGKIAILGPITWSFSVPALSFTTIAIESRIAIAKISFGRGLKLPEAPSIIKRITVCRNHTP